MSFNLSPARAAYESQSLTNRPWVWYHVMLHGRFVDSIQALKAIRGTENLRLLAPTLRIVGIYIALALAYVRAGRKETN